LTGSWVAEHCQGQVQHLHKALVAAAAGQLQELQKALLRADAKVCPVVQLLLGCRAAVVQYKRSTCKYKAI
jgi:hypothetical protein